MKQFYQLIFTALFLFYAFITNAQNTENSPLSRYGLGELRSTTTSWMSGMANSGTAYISDQLMNPMNPAASAFLKQTDVELGIFAKYNRLQDNKENTIKDWSGNLNQLSIAIPLRNSINEVLDRKKYHHAYAIQIGLSPFSSVGYRSDIIDNTDTLNQLSRSVQGDGLINSFNLGASYRYKNYSIGLLMSYLFGNLNYNQKLIYVTVPATYDSYLTDKVHISGWRPAIGLMFQSIINKKEIRKDNSLRKQLLSFGLVLNVPTNYTGSYTALHTTRFESDLNLVDTVLYLNEQTEKGKLPFGLKAGAYYNHKEKYGLMASLNLDEWQNAEFTSGLIGTAKSASQFSLGGWFRPGQGNFDKFFKKSTYRFGAYLGNDYRSIEGDEATNLGLSFGWSYPILFLRQDAMVHLNFDLGQRKLGEQLTENYFMIHFGISINDNEWFLKRRYN